MKQDADFFKVWGGISGAQATLRALLSLDLPLPLIGRLVSDNAAARFRLPFKGGIRPGADADLAFIDQSASKPVRESELLDRHGLSPYVGRALRGTVRRTMLRGETIFLDGAVAGKPRGKHLLPEHIAKK
jgi:allantoinase